jgi:transposase-like protein
MQFHRNAKLGLAGRRELVLAIAGGCSIRQSAASFNVSPATAHRWWRRWQQATDRERAGLACMFDRWRDWLRPLDGVEGALPLRALKDASVSAGAGQSLRVALPR